MATLEPDGPPRLPTASARRTGARVIPTEVLAPAWLAVAVVTALATWATIADAERVPATLDVVVAVAALALLPWLWSSRAVPVALALAVLAAVSGAATPAATAGTLHVARWFPVRTAVPVAVVGAAAHAVQALWRPVGLPLGWWVLCDVAVHAALLGWGAYWQERAVVLTSLRERALRAEAEQERRVAEARLAERTRIAREMHDTLAHRLSLLAATAGALEYRPDAPAQQLAEAAARVRGGVSDALEDLRQVVRLLRAGTGEGSDGLLPVPGLSDVERLVAEARAAGGDVTYERTGDAAPPPRVAAAGYRVVQEGLTNARRHAPGARVRVVVDSRPGGVRVRVRDDGSHRAATARAAGSGTGLVGLRERVTLLGGRLEAGPRPDAPGFAVEAWLPWD